MNDPRSNHTASLLCPRCHRAIALVDVDRRNALARCRACGRFFDLVSEPVGVVDGPPPPGITVELTGGASSRELPYRCSSATHAPELRITRQWRWQHWSTTLGLTVSAAVAAMMTALGVHMLIAGSVSVGLIAASAGLATTYAALGHLLNRTTVLVTPTWLTVRHHLPWPGGRELPSHELRQLYCTEYVLKGVVYHALHAILRDGSRVRLLEELESHAHAAFLEQTIERFLELRDEAVPGEARPSRLHLRARAVRSAG